VRVISQWRLGSNDWGIALFCVFRSGNFFGFTLLGFVFEWQTWPVGYTVPPEIAAEWDKDREFLKGDRW
jgi:hypothetical protein